MDVLFIADPLAEFKIYKDSTFAMMQESVARGHRLFFCEVWQLARIESGEVQASVEPLQLTGNPASWFSLGEKTTRALSQFDAVVMRKDPPFDMEYVVATYLLELAERQGAQVFNRPGAVRSHNEKFAITGFPELIAPTLVSRDIDRLKAFHAKHRDVIVKPLDGMGGMGIFRVKDDELNLGAIIETVSDFGRKSVMVQRYIPEIVDGDKRILLIDGEPVPFALARVPQGKEIRGNLAAGGVGRAQPLSERDRAIAARVGPVVREAGLMLVGLDVIGDYLTEVNVTSPTCFREIMDQTGYPVAAKFIDAVEARHKPASAMQRQTL
jgi:glutathione synthase